MTEPGRLFIGALGLVPKKHVSRFARRLASFPSQVAVRRFAARYGARLDEAEKPIEEYRSVLEFFTRRLKPGIRPLDPDPRAVLCPVDGRFLAGGPIEQGRLYQAKGRSFTLGALLAEAGAEDRFRLGAYFVLYLAPKDYHRIHAPVSGLVRGWTYVPGRLYPVNAAAVAHVDQLFARNERLITHIDTELFGRVDVVKVGATCVGHIKVSYDDTVVTNVANHASLAHRTYERPIPIERGAELGVFEMGSTVIVVVERSLDVLVREPGGEIRLGIALAHAPIPSG